ncbi:hypothetical protein LTR85_006283 [Meristemomyces frigidus]|nr:hypothetical protein LTR85_006283 [Meristemomyces frigidus]
MALQTPRQRLQRPSYGNTSAEKQASFSGSTSVNRKASLQALTGAPRTPGKMDGSDLEVGDTVNVPGDMYGTVKFIGTVRGKNGKFVGVELDRDFAARGKNDGDVDGNRYFTTSIPGAGIFLPVHRAEKRNSPSVSIDSFPATPNTPSYSTLNGHRTKAEAAYTPPTPALPHKFSQTVGPGARPVSPQFKPKRPSLPRPESPFRKQPPSLAPTPARALSQSVRGGRPALAPTTTPSRNNLRSSTNTRPPASQTPRPYSRTGSRLGHRQPDSVAEEERTPVGFASTTNGRKTSTSSVPSFSQPLRSPSRLGSAGGPDAEIHRLKKELADRDRRLDEQAVSLAEMDASVKELSTLMPADGVTPGGGRRGGELGDEDEQTAAQLRQLLREKNEKIGLMTQDFDSHRADFRSTLDSLEMASTETERVYEEQKRDLLAQIAELQSQNETLQQEVGMGSSREDFEGVATQLKQLEELVAELEEGLEESRRGEAEARGEVEFLRGEVERGRSELKREREKAAAMSKSGAEGVSTKELEQKDDEIRGLKAIIHSLSSGSDSAATDGQIPDAGALKRVQDALEQSMLEKEDLEKEIEQLRRDSAMTNGNGHAASHVRNESERTATAPESGTPVRQRSGTLRATFAEHARRSGLAEGDLPSDVQGEEDADGAESEGIYCEMCESRDHDTLECTKLQSHDNSISSSPAKSPSAAAPEQAYSPGKENEGASKASDKKADEDKWCALCEKDGHLAFDCPEEQY